MCATEKDDGVLLAGLKLKDDETPPILELRRISVSLGRDDDGEEVTAALLEPIGRPAAERNREAEEQETHDLDLAADVARVVAALQQLGSATKKDAVVLKAQLKAQRGRACFDIAMSQGLIKNKGSTKSPVYVVAAQGEGGREKNQKRDGTSQTSPSSSAASRDVRDVEGRRDATQSEAVADGDAASSDDPRRDKPGGGA